MDVIKLRREFRMKTKNTTRAEKQKEYEYFSDDYVFFLEEELIKLRLCGVSQQSELLFALLRYTMPDQFTDVALKNIVKGFVEQSK